MNRVCAYCGARFVSSTMTTVRRKRGPSDALKWGIFATAIVFPIVGLIPGLAYAHDRDRAHRAAARLWLFAGLASTLVYMLVFLT
ncbi:MAG: hypothetical protein H7138_07605 [Myxococcales bacterium]|nr:hypothetical protein [Myxococcales bacterium]